MSFLVWVADANLSGNVMDVSSYSYDSQRLSGFQSGTAASAIRVNTALRQSTLVTMAIMNAMGLSSLGYDDSSSDIEDAIEGFFNDRQVQALTTLDGTETPAVGYQIGSAKYKLSGGGTSVTANPTLIGTESDLAGLQINSTKFANHKMIPKTLWSGSQAASTNTQIVLNDYVSSYETIEVYAQTIDSTNTRYNAVGKCITSIYDSRMIIDAVNTDWSISKIYISLLSQSLIVVQGDNNVNIIKVVGYKSI